MDPRRDKDLLDNLYLNRVGRSPNDDQWELTRKGFSDANNCNQDHFLLFHKLTNLIPS